MPGPEMNMGNREIPRWAEMITATVLGAVVLAVGAVSYLFTHFETVEAAFKSEDRVTQRLDRIENKVDEVLKQVRDK